MLTALGFLFVVFQVSALAEQINKQEEHYHKDSEFKNFLEATKMLTSVKNADNVTAQISAMYLLYDFAKKYPKNNLEKVIKVLNKYATPAIYNNSKSLIQTPSKSSNNLKSIVGDRKTINEWKESGEPHQKIASTALELNKKLFIYALEHKIKINLSDVIIFDLDIEKDFNENIFKKKFKLFDITKHSPRIIFLRCDFSATTNSWFKKEIDFSTGYWFSRIGLSKESVKGRMDINLSRFIKCDLNGCNFSYSNLWGVTFENCKLKATKFNQAECEGSEFIYYEDNDYPIKTNEKINEKIGVQFEKMLFIDKVFFRGFSKEQNRDTEVKYAVIYSNSKSCFSNRAEYEKFVKYKNKTELEDINIIAKIKQLICKEF